MTTDGDADAGGWNAEAEPVDGGPVRRRVHRGYMKLLIVAWVVFGVALFLPSLYLDQPFNWGFEAFWYALQFSFILFDPRINLAAWIGTLSNVVILILAPIFRAGGKQPGKEIFFDIAALGSGLWVWAIPFLLGPEVFGLGYYVWALAHLAVGTRIFWKKIYFDKLGNLPAGTRKRSAQAAAAKQDDWPKDQTGNWDEQNQDRTAKKDA